MGRRRLPSTFVDEEKAFVDEEKAFVDEEKAFVFSLLLVREGGHWALRPTA